MIVTIDGPAGSGKSTTARAVADKLGYVYLDTGAMYRAVALAFLREDAGATPEDAREVLPDVTVDVRYHGDDMHVFLNGEDVTEEIRTSDVGTMASEISALSAVREKLLHEQQRIGEKRNETDGGVVLDGRDTGTVVFPDADVKIFMVADPRERARRRLKEYEEQGDRPSLDDVQREIESRDELDRNRDIAPLKKADDAVELDTTGCTIEDQVQFVIDQVRGE
jgi:cytidylate kinase